MLVQAQKAIIRRVGIETDSQQIDISMANLSQLFMIQFMEAPMRLRSGRLTHDTVRLPMFFTLHLR